MQTLKMLIDKWSGPAGLMVIFGLIVWGVQLNVATITQTRLIERNQANIELLLDKVGQSELNAARTAIILDQIDARSRVNQQDIRAHNKEAETWKQQIIRNQDSIEALK